MSNPDLICEVRTSGGTYRDWQSVQVEQNYMSEDWNRSFRLVCAEPSAVGNLRLKPGDRVDIALAGQVVIKAGFIRDRQAAYDANRHAVQITGYGRAGLITEASINGGTGQYRGYKIDAIANSVLKPYGLKFRVQNGPDGWETPFTNVMVRMGETPFDLISRLAKQRGLFFYADVDGNLVAGPKSDGGMVQFIEGVNILAANCQLRHLAVEGLIVDAQQSGSDSLFGKKAAEVRASSAVTGGAPGAVRTILAEMPLNQREAQLRTDWEAAALQSMALQLQITYQGWLKPGVGGLWEPSDGVSVKSPMLFPTESGTEELKVAGYSYMQDTNAGTITTVDLVNKLAWEQRKPNAKENDGFYDVTTAPAKAEAVT
ncbi:phage baseplate assembly protein [Methylobacterium sp. WL19]|uniref:phage baseplate assembly protein n=1 Tax=Methylobacterium sp. WL19 TaxID=2603896 RepID=UPI0011CBAB27|nr:hypothetical protein [Methylobacterium sp. WL19]TXN27139.1 hypothetical protein FV220_12515 [Methylobacterium sp. WL19]